MHMIDSRDNTIRPALMGKWQPTGAIYISRKLALILCTIAIMVVFTAFHLLQVLYEMASGTFLVLASTLRALNWALDAAISDPLTVVHVLIPSLAQVLCSWFIQSPSLPCVILAIACPSPAPRWSLVSFRCPPLSIRASTLLWNRLSSCFYLWVHPSLACQTPLFHFLSLSVRPSFSFKPLSRRHSVLLTSQCLANGLAWAVEGVVPQSGHSSTLSNLVRSHFEGLGIQRLQHSCHP